MALVGGPGRSAGLSRSRSAQGAGAVAPAAMSAALDLRSKEEKDAELDKRIEALRKKNEALIRRYQEIEEDRRKAEQEGVAVTTLRRARPPHPEFDGRRATRGVTVTVVSPPGEKRVTRDKKAPGVPKPPRGSGRSPRGDPTPPAEPFWEGGAGDGGSAGGRGRRARGRGAAATAGGGDGPDRKSKEWEERRRQNIEKMNEEMEKIAEYERNQRDGLNEKNPVRNFLDDPRRSGPVSDGDRREGSRRHVRNWGGADFDKVKAGMERDKTRQGPTGRRPSPKSGASLDMTLSMTGRERAEYVRWKQEREQIDRERLARHRKPGGQWRREWDAKKPDGGFKAGSDPNLSDPSNRFPPKPPTLGEFLTPRRPQRRRKGRGGGAKPYSMHDNRWDKEPPVTQTPKQEVVEAPLGSQTEDDEDEWEDVSEDGDSAGPSSEGRTPRSLSPVGSPRGGHNHEPPPENQAAPQKASTGTTATQGAVEFPPDAVEITDFQREAPRCPRAAPPATPRWFPVEFHWTMDNTIPNYTFNYTYDDFIYDLDGYEVPPGHRAILALYALIFLLGVLGNSAVIWVTAFELRRTVNGVWFLNLSLADLLCCLALPFLAFPLARDHHWPLGPFACKLLPSLTILNMFASVLLLTAISADRCALVTRPVWCQNHRTLRLARVACGAAWFLAALLTLPSFIFRTVRRDDFSDKTTCVLDYAAVGRHQHLTELVTAVTRFVAGFLVPFVVITVCYGLLLARVHSKGFARSKKATKLILVVIVSFFVCWLPYHVVGLIMASASPRSPLFKGARDADAAVTGVAYVNSCINPIIYVVMGQDFKDKLRHSWRSILRGVLSDEPTSTLGDSRMKTKSTVDDQSVSTTI
ncbi:uncharacterized protein [Patagioenas fasciata]|uniref:uncharacterized protein isoform X2 n=1 Tax=Patagioenas fasciata TaxID=372321 RepID=UPI003A992FFE